MSAPILDILGCLKPEQIAEIRPTAHKWHAVESLKNQLPLGLPDVADQSVPRDSSRYIWFQTLSPLQRKQNLAERLVIAIRLIDSRAERYRQEVGN